MSLATVARLDDVIQLGLKRIGQLFCKHKGAVLCRTKTRLFLRCPDCQMETEGFRIGEVEGRKT